MYRAGALLPLLEYGRMERYHLIDTTMNVQKYKDELMLVGRVLASIIFIVAGFSKIGTFAATSGYVGSVLPFPELITALVIVIELVGGLMVLVGFKMQLAAWSIAIFTLLAAFLFHFDLADQMQSGQFMKNLSIAGGFIYLALVGPGKYALGGMMKKKDSVTPAM